MSNSDNEVKANSDFGSALAEARKSRNYTVEQIHAQLKIPVHIIKAIESSDLDSLPEPAYIQGYLRAYAKFLEVSETAILQKFNRVMPHAQVSELKPRTGLSKGKNSQSPPIIMVTVFLIFSALAAIIYGSFQYYQRKASVMESEFEAKQHEITASSLDSPLNHTAQIEQQAVITDNDELILQQPATTEQQVGQTESQAEVSTDAGSTIEIVTEDTAVENVESVQASVDNQAEPDTIEIVAEDGAWVEVRDANDERLFYNMIPPGASRTIDGQAPFYVSMGNASTTWVLINGLEVNISKYTRSNNTAKFRVSSEQKNVIFH